MTETVHEVRALVSALTRSRKIDTHAHTGVIYAAAAQPPLLTELRAATVSNIGRGNGGGTAPHQRTMLNVGASDLLTAIEKRVRTWAIRAGYRPPRTGWPPVEELLAHWHARTDGDPDLDPKHYSRVLRGWVGAISDLMDPPYRYPIEQPCPTCGAEWTTGDIDQGTDPNRALNVIERRPADRSIAICHACGYEWHGVAGAHTLANAIEHHGHTLTCAGETDLDAVRLGPADLAVTIPPSTTRIPA